MKVSFMKRPIVLYLATFLWRAAVAQDDEKSTMLHDLLRETKEVSRVARNAYLRGATNNTDNMFHEHVIESFRRVQELVPPGAIWINLNENEDYTARHECSFVQAGDKFYLFGGRESPRRMDTYDYASNTWSRSATAPFDFNHFQAIEYEGLIWVIGAYKTNDFPNEAVAENVYVFDPANDVWMLGPSIPASRRRGSGGLQVYNGKFYLVAGNTNGHSGGFVNWMDEYDPRTGQWRMLPDAPRARDHFHAIVIESRLYAAGGRRTESFNTFGLVIPEVDVYDFISESWLPASSSPDDLPEPRAAAVTAAFSGKVLLAGGESGRSEFAHDVVHSLDPTTGKWEEVDPLTYGRHGTQAIVSGQGVYVTAGSPTRGGNNQHNMEVYNQNAPAGSASVAGLLSAPSTVDVMVGAPATIILKQVGGNQGIFVNSVTLTGSRFAILGGATSPVLIPNGDALDVVVEYTGTDDDDNQGLLYIEYSGDHSLLVDLVGKAIDDSDNPATPPSVDGTPVPVDPTPAPAEPTPVPVDSTPSPVDAMPVNDVDNEDNKNNAQPTEDTGTSTTTIATTTTKVATTPSTPQETTPTSSSSTEEMSDLDIESLVIVNAESNQDVSSVDEWKGYTQGSPFLLNIRAEPHGLVSGIWFTLSGPRRAVRVEKSAPYSLYGDVEGDYFGKKLPSGIYTVTAQAFGLDGNRGNLLWRTFSV